MYKLLTIDLDGTLLNSYGEISLENEKAIKEIIKKGVEVVIASGRTKSAIDAFAEKLGATNYIISGNGTILYDNQNNNILFHSFLKKEKILKIIKICEENSIYYSLYTPNEIISKNFKYNVAYYNFENTRKPMEKQIKINIVEDMYRYIDQNDVDITKITICDENKTIFNRIMNKLHTIDGLNILDVEHMSRKTIKNGTLDVNINYFYTEITNKGINKWVAIQKLLDILNIKSEEVISIGDNINDKEMIENAGLGISMGESFLKAQNIGDIFIGNNNSDDISKVLRKIFD